MMRSCALSLLLLATALPATAGSVAESSYQQGRKTLDAAAESTGTTAWLARGTPVLIEASGTLYQGAERQGRAPDAATPAAFRETWAFDPASGRLGREYHQQRPDGTEEWIRELFPAPGEQIVWLRRDDRAIRLLGPDATVTRDRNLRRFPHLMLDEVLGQPRAIRSIGRHGPFHGVQAQTRQREPLSLFFGGEENALNLVEYLTTLPGFADSVVSWKFGDYRDHVGLGQVPWWYGIIVNHEWYTEMEVRRISTDPDEVAGFLDLPETVPVRTVEAPERVDPTAEARVEQLAEGVWAVFDLRPGFHSLFVEFGSYVVAVGAPSGSPLLNELPAGDVIDQPHDAWLSQRYLDLVADTVPGKPVRYVLLTHFHGDHAGGLFAFADGQTRLLVHESEKKAIQNLLGRSHSLCPEEGPRRAGLQVETVDKRRVIEDGQQRLEILDVGKNPHSEHMLVAWLPGPRILFVADLLTAADGRPAPQSERLNRHFLDWLDRRGLEPDLIITAHGDGRLPGAGARLAQKR